MQGFVIIDNSPIEFIIAGPKDGRDRVLVATVNAKLDLMGAAAAPGYGEDIRPANDVLSLLFPRLRAINSVVSRPLGDVSPDSDSRNSSFIFVWNGYTSRSGRRWVKRMFNEFLPHIHEAIAKGDKDELTWSLGPLIRHCSEEMEKGRRRRAMLLFGLSIYLIVALLVGTFQMFVKGHI
jgi:hypothetical protein